MSDYYEDEHDQFDSTEGYYNEDPNDPIYYADGMGYECDDDDECDDEDEEEEYDEETSDYYLSDAPGEPPEGYESWAEWYYMTGGDRPVRYRAQPQRIENQPGAGCLGFVLMIILVVIIGW